MANCFQFCFNFAFKTILCRYIKGVFWDKRWGTWKATDCKGKGLGSHATEEAAAEAGAYTRPLFSLSSALLWDTLGGLMEVW
jgi:hypothetical protein